MKKPSEAKEIKRMPRIVTEKPFGIRSYVFREDEYEKAEAIANILKGMPIASANILLDKMKDYLLLTEFK